MQSRAHRPTRPYPNSSHRIESRPQRAAVSRVAGPARRGVMDVFTRGPDDRQPLRDRALPKLAAHRAAPVQQSGEEPERVMFATDAQVVARLNDQTLWPPKVTGGLVAVLSRYCYPLMLKEVEKKYTVEEAANAIVRVLRPMQQMTNVEQLCTLQVFMANVFIVDETSRDAVEEELREHHDPAR